MSAKFRPDREFMTGEVKVELGRKGSKRLVKVSVGPLSALMLDQPEADVVADLLDDALDYYDSHPELWG